MDCSKTENYLKEKARMTGVMSNGVECAIACNRCPLGSDNNSLGTDCASFEQLRPQEAINIVQKWSDEHPRKTMLNDFIEKYPNAPLYNGIPQPCPWSLGYELQPDADGCYGKDCCDCWNRPLMEE